jgi:hypothetical protein
MVGDHGVQAGGDETAERIRQGKLGINRQPQCAAVAGQPFAFGQHAADLLGVQGIATSLLKQPSL